MFSNYGPLRNYTCISWELIHNQLGTYSQCKMRVQAEKTMGHKVAHRSGLFFFFLNCKWSLYSLICKPAKNHRLSARNEERLCPKVTCSPTLCVAHGYLNVCTWNLHKRDGALTKATFRADQSRFQLCWTPWLLAGEKFQLDPSVKGSSPILGPPTLSLHRTWDPVMSLQVEKDG